MRALFYLVIASLATVTAAIAAAYVPGVSPAYRASLAFVAVWVVPCTFIACMINAEQRA
jgi:hypothetical protein